ncbi:MAG: PH domain-containing protein [Holophagae bacterium]
MIEALKAPVLRLLRVPPAPQPPAGARDTVRVFRASRKYLRLKLLGWGVSQLLTLAGVVAAIVVLHLMATGRIEVLQDLPHRAIVLRLMGWAEFLGVAFFVIQLPFSLLPVILDWELRWYTVTDRSLRIREGVWKVNELTMTFANIQEVSIRQGPLERLFGISNLRVRTAGGGQRNPNDPGSEEKSGHIGYFRGVDDAPGIRDLILERLKRLRDAGLGDPEQPAVEVAPHDATIDAARELLEEARALRQAAESGARL